MGLVHLIWGAFVSAERVNLLALIDPETAFSVTELSGLSRALIEVLRISSN